MTCVTSYGMSASALLLMAMLAAPGDVEGQQGSSSWAPVSAGIRIGYDDRTSGEVVGAQLHIPVVRSGHVEIMPSADITFLTRLREYQYNLDAVYVSAGRRGGAYAGAGIGWRNSIFGIVAAEPRETIRTYSIVAGLRGGLAESFGTQLEVRWLFLNQDVFDPRTVTLGVNFYLGGGSGAGGR